MTEQNKIQLNQIPPNSSPYHCFGLEQFIANNRSKIGSPLNNYILQNKLYFDQCDLLIELLNDYDKSKLQCINLNNIKLCNSINQLNSTQFLKKETENPKSKINQEVFRSIKDEISFHLSEQDYLNNLRDSIKSQQIQETQEYSSIELNFSK
eukprot:TRINITY_DN23113_c0_g1_i1.p2 TRINITY_DN23113_c0_g1~~TRINITY_DN23113_c0_g1_i1.p2  ORF type:complete len:152 (+),score=22.60 TRINITY_DN23113_c0_g1_i1:453-908(+)